jgi:hypothetical protein
MAKVLGTGPEGSRDKATITAPALTISSIRLQQDYLKMLQVF